MNLTQLLQMGGTKKEQSQQVDLFLHNVWVLFGFYIFTILFIIYLAIHQDTLSILVLFLIGFLVYFFTSNMVVVMVIAVAFTGLIRFVDLSDTIPLGNSFEGMETQDESSEHPLDVSGGATLSLAAADTKTGLLEQSFSAVTKSEDLEKLKLQKDILEKIEKLEPLISTVSGFSNMMKKG